jgi:hypothetical protein
MMRIDERNAAMLNLDIAWARANAPVWLAPPDDETLLISLHKARYQCPVLPAEARHASAKFLRDGGHLVWGMEILPEGQLP